MADMYGRLTHRPGVCLVTAGPGATNSLTGIAQAYTAASPVVHISGTVPRQGRKGEFHGVDDTGFVRKIFQPITKWSASVGEVPDIPAVLARAFSIASSGQPGPVHVDLPVDLLEEEPTEVTSYQREPTRRVPPEEALVEQVAELLLGARRPVICGGKALRTLSASGELATLAELLGAPVVFPYEGEGVLHPSHPLCAGAYNGLLAHPLPLQLVEECDVLLAIGMRPGTSSAVMLDSSAPDDYVFLSPEEAEGGGGPASITAVVDPKAMLAALIERIQPVARPNAEAIEARIAEAKKAFRLALDQEVERYRGQRPIHFGLVLKELVPLLDEDALIVADVGNHGVWTSKWMDVNGTQTLISPGSWGAMGFALPGAIAASLVYPERQVVALTGDGAFLMSYSDFGTALEVGANVVFVILNDSRHGMIYTLQMRDFGRTFSTEIRSPDFAKFAESFGAVGVRVEDDSQLRNAFRQALAARSPAIVDVVSGYDFPHPAPEELLQRAQH
jgi:acetolactate synthase-1/2/3 large subunit